MRRVQPYTIGEWTIRGVDDWLMFVTDAAGMWHYFTTECDPAWRRLPYDIAFDENDNWTDEGVLVVGVLMIRRGERPYAAVDADAIADTEQHFGRPAAFQDGVDFYQETAIAEWPSCNASPIVSYRGMVHHDYDMAGAARARARFRREFPRFALE